MSNKLKNIKAVHPNCDRLTRLASAVGTAHPTSLTVLPDNARFDISGSHCPQGGTKKLSSYNPAKLYFDTAVCAMYWDGTNTINATTTYNQPRIMNLSTYPGNPQGIRVSYTPNSTSNSGWGYLYAKKMVDGVRGSEETIAKARARFTGRFSSWGAWYGNNVIRTIYVDVLVKDSCYPDFGQYNHTRLGAGTAGTNPSGLQSWNTSTVNVKTGINIMNRW